MDHRDACGSLQVAKHDVDRLAERLNYVADRILIGLWGKNDRRLWHDR